MQSDGKYYDHYTYYNHRTAEDFFLFFLKFFKKINMLMSVILKALSCGLETCRIWFQAFATGFYYESKLQFVYVVVSYRRKEIFSIYILSISFQEALHVSKWLWNFSARTNSLIVLGKVFKEPYNLFWRFLM